MPGYIESVIKTAWQHVAIVKKDGMANISRAPRGAGFFLSAAILSVVQFASLHAQAVPALKLIPMPREVQSGKLLSLDRGILIRTGSRDAEDRFTAEELRATLKERGIPSRSTGVLVELLRTSTPSSRALLHPRISGSSRKCTMKATSSSPAAVVSL